MTRSPVREEIVACLDLTNCPEGEVLSAVEPNKAVDRYFTQWCNALVPHRGWEVPSSMYVLYEEGYGLGRGEGRIPVVEHQTTDDRCLVSLDPEWRDYTVEVRLRVLGTTTVLNSDDDVRVVPWAGIVFRMEDIRHYYFFCLQPPDKLVLYRRSDDDWHILAEDSLNIDSTRYYQLRVALSGSRLRCSLDGEEVFAVTDYTFQRGKAGVRFNTQVRLNELQVRMTPGMHQRLARIKQHREDQLRQISARYPQPILAKQLDLRQFYPFELLFAPLINRANKDLLLTCSNPLPRVVALTLDGESLWEQPGQLRLHFTTEPKDDGHVDIVGIYNDQLAILDGRNGQVLCKRPLPTLTGRELKWVFRTYCCVNLSGGTQSREIVIREGDAADTLWAYDEGLNELWSAQQVYPCAGHRFSVGFCDVDGDGREEVLAGGTLLSADGERLWQMEDAERVIRTFDAGHIDSLLVGRFAADEEVDPVAFLCCGSAGLYVLDAMTGKLRDIHRIGHAQGGYAGNFRPEELGLEVVVGCRWGNYGLLSIFSGSGERLLTFQPDYVGQWGRSVNWTGDGEELLAITSHPESLGLYDGYGRKVVPIPLTLLPAKDFYDAIYTGNQFEIIDLLGDPRDELVAIGEGVMHVLTQSTPLEQRVSVYRPTRRLNVSWPGWVGKSLL
ncbi:MAG: hypothetical protein HY709_01985 [Candidatus Latescibacteria bacterium]|nr:hypothetical protein [Candidatus Latescibacterota bacterium]